MSKNYTFEIYDADDAVVDHETITADTIEEAEHILEMPPHPVGWARYELEDVEEDVS